MEDVRKFVIQKHTRQDQPIHWDLMLEAGEFLETFRLELPPDRLPNQRCVAVRIFNHPRKFLTYEGSVNNGVGSVQIAEAGIYRLVSKSETHWELELHGKILKSVFTLNHIEADKWELSAS